MTFDLAAVGTQVHERAVEWAALGLSWSTGPIHPNHGKAVASADFEGAGWIAQITIWETGETELETVRTSDRFGVNKHYDLESVAKLSTVFAEFAALIRDGAVPEAAVTYTA